MEPLCHRCGTTIVSGETFCSNCGAPQLRIEEGVEGVEAFNAVSPRQPGLETREPSWKDAILAPAIFAVPVGLLTSNLLPFGASAPFFFIIAGAVAAVNLYRRRARTALLNTRVGLRIGLLLGLLAGILSTTIDGVLMVLQRYLLHDPAAPDRTVQAITDIFLQPYTQNPQAAIEMHDLIGAIGTPDGKAALMLSFMIISSLGVLIFSVLGGALGARFFSARKLSLKDR
jgi:zinc-ribbon domain